MEYPTPGGGLVTRLHARHANVVSLSWGGGEFSGETGYDTYFNHSGVAFVASSIRCVRTPALLSRF